MKKMILMVMALMMSCCYVIGAEEVAKVAVSQPWMPVLGELASVIISVVGPALTILITALVWKLLGKLGVEKNIAIDLLMRKYVKQGINYADSWANKQAAKPLGDQKMIAAMDHIIGLIAESKLPKMAEDKLKEMIEAQLFFDKTQDPVAEKSNVISE